jgi:hypothetical protein
VCVRGEFLYVITITASELKDFPLLNYQPARATCACVAQSERPPCENAKRIFIAASPSHQRKITEAIIFH